MSMLKEYWCKIPPEFQDEFDNDLFKTNLYRSKIIASSLLITSIPLLYIDYLNHQGGLWIITTGYRLLFYTHLLLVLVALIPLIIIPVIKPHSVHRAFNWQKIWVVCFYVLILIVGAVTSMADQKIHGAITAYIISALGFAAIAYFKPITSLVAYLLSLCLFIVGISQMQLNPEVLKGHYINGSFLIMIAWIFSVTLFNTRLNDFFNKKRLEIYANFDYLTGCLNRRAFINRLEQEIERAKREQTIISIVLVDIDLFKQVNDRFGHLAGDFVLKQLIDCFNNSCRNYDFIGRFGGEEFIICLPNTTLGVAAEVAERLRCIVEETKIIYDSNIINTTVSLGVAALEPTYKENIDKFISRADSAMYRAKIKRNNVCLSSFNN
jgi:diguanylate cyclase (GGDEF)-like protein